jgi:hypothetical protein
VCTEPTHREALLVLNVQNKETTLTILSLRRVLQISKHFGKNLTFAKSVPLIVYYVAYINEKHC